MVCSSGRETFSRAERESKRGVVLKEEAAALPEISHGFLVRSDQGSAFETDRPGVLLHDACEALQEDRLSGAAWAEHGEHTPAGDAEIDTLQNGAFPKALGQPGNTQEWSLCGGGAHQMKKELTT